MLLRISALNTDESIKATPTGWLTPLRVSRLKFQLIHDSLQNFEYYTCFESDLYLDLYNSVDLYYWNFYLAD